MRCATAQRCHWNRNCKYNGIFTVFFCVLFFLLFFFSINQKRKRHSTLSSESANKTKNDKPTHILLLLLLLHDNNSNDLFSRFFFYFGVFCFVVVAIAYMWGEKFNKCKPSSLKMSLIWLLLLFFVSILQPQSRYDNTQNFAISRYDVCTTVRSALFFHWFCSVFNINSIHIAHKHARTQTDVVCVYTDRQTASVTTQNFDQHTIRYKNKFICVDVMCTRYVNYQWIFQIVNKCSFYPPFCASQQRISFRFRGWQLISRFIVMNFTLNSI